jgi:diphosphomevalonate decarboxylase
MTANSARAVAHANIALAKYWGKASIAENLTAVPSLSLTLEPLRTVTHVTFDPSLDSDQAQLDGKPLSGRALTRIVTLLDRVRARAELGSFARVESENELPTAAGLASSASGFAALALAAQAAAGLGVDLGTVSELARASSASAARSAYGGWVALEAGAARAERVAPPAHFPVVMLVALTARGPKATSSTEGMLHTAATSPYFAAWVAHAPTLFAEVQSAVLACDLERLGAAMEQSALMMHASMLAARPALRYFRPATLAVMETVETLRRQGTLAFFTMDAGPHVKVLAAPENETSVARALAQTPGVERVLHCRPGPDAKLADDGGET